MPSFIPFEFPTTADGKYIAMIPDNCILQRRREQLDLTQQQVAEMANMPLRQYQRIEQGQSDLRSSKMEHGLAICAALLLDPYQMVCPNVKQANPDSLKPLPPIDITIPDDLNKKKVGRKPIRRDIMHVFVNHPKYSMLIPDEVLSALGKPDYIQVRQKTDEHRILILPVSGDIEKSREYQEKIDVPRSVYKGQFLGIPGKDYINYVAEGLNWNDQPYVVESRKVTDDKGAIGILVDLETAESSENFDCDPVIPWCFIDDDEDLADDQDNDEE